MTNWLCITNSDNWQIIKKNHVWGVPSRHQNTISKVKPGDKLLIYIKQERDHDKNIIEPRIPAVYEANQRYTMTPQNCSRPYREWAVNPFPLE